MSSAEHKSRLLRGAVCEYLDEESGVEELVQDLGIILDEEANNYIRMAASYLQAKHKLFANTDKQNSSIDKEIANES